MTQVCGVSLNARSLNLRPAAKLCETCVTGACATGALENYRITHDLLKYCTSEKADMKIAVAVIVCRVVLCVSGVTVSVCLSATSGTGVRAGAVTNMATSDTQRENG